MTGSQGKESNMQITTEGRCISCGHKLNLKTDRKKWICPRCGAEYRHELKNGDMPRESMAILTQTKEPAAAVLTAARWAQREMLLSVPEKTVNKYVRESLASAIANDIMERIEITERPIPEQCAIEYRARLRIVRSDYEFE